jgi:hypothetical protein
MHTIFWLENLQVRDHLEDQGIDGEIFDLIFEEGWKVWTGYIWLRIGASGGAL